MTDDGNDQPSRARRQVGQTLGVAIVGAVAGGAVSGALGPGFAVATHPGWWILVGLGLVVLVLGLLTTTRWAYTTARTTADRLSEPPPHASTPQQAAVGISRPAQNL